MLNKLRTKIETIMVGSKDADDGFTEHALSGAARLYGGVAKIRETLYRKNIKKRFRLPCYVISVGNLTVGGTGKTPMVIYLAGLVTNLGYTAAIVSRGYGGEASSVGGVVSDGSSLLLNAKMAGDEPYMMAKRLLHLSVPVVVGSNRYEAGMTAVRHFKPDIIILDDGFQHMKLERDLNICLFDAGCPLGNGCVMPRGTLREPAAAVNRADIIVLTRAGDDDRATVEHFRSSVKVAGADAGVDRLPVFTSCHTAVVTASEPVERDVYAFSGIAKNEAFRKTVLEAGYFIKGFKEYPDHYYYSSEDCIDIEGNAEKSGAVAVITTEKDYAKIETLFDWRLKLIIINIDIDFGNDENRFKALIRDNILKRH